MADGATMPGGALIPRASIHELVAARQQAEALFGEAWDKLHEAYRMASAAAPSGTCDLPFLAAGSRYSRSGNPDIDTAEKFGAYVRDQLNRSTWRHVIKVTQLDQLMDRQERDAFNAALESAPPEASVENIAATVDRLIGEADLIWKRGIANVFSTLDRRFRSHDGFKVGSRIVLSNALSEFGAWNHYQRHDDKLFDVERAFHRLDGSEPPENRYSGGAVSLIDEQRRAFGLGKFSAFEVETDFFRIKVFGNGNIHLWFKRKDLVERVNQVLADYYGATLGASADVADVKHTPSGAVARNMGWFPTPEAVVSRVLDEGRIWTADNHAGRYPELTVLEPSAGEGALALPCRNAGHAVVCVELDPGRAALLRTRGLITRQADFLTTGHADFGRLFDRILMNPPFDRGLDVEHVIHALQFLAEGGRLVAVMSAGVEFREDARTVAFRREVERRGGHFRDLPAGSFAPATNVNSCLCIIGGRR